MDGNPQVLLKKGTAVKIWIESSTDWIRVKAYNAKENREQASGITIIYLFNEDLPENVDRERLVKEKIMEILQAENGAPL